VIERVREIVDLDWSDIVVDHFEINSRSWKIGMRCHAEVRRNQNRDGTSNLLRSSEGARSSC